MDRAVISSTGRYLPEFTLANEDMVQFSPEARKLIGDKTGVFTRHFAAADQCTSDLAVRAALDCLQKIDFPAGEIDGIIVSTSSPDRMQPATATRVQDLIGANRAFAFDINSVCSGSSFGIAVADAMIRAGLCRTVLLIAAEVYSKILYPKDFSTYPYFGDGAGAVLLEPSEDETGILDFSHEVDGSGGCFLNMPAGGSARPATHDTVDAQLHFVKQEGGHVFKYAVRKMAEASAHLLDKNGIPPAELDLLVAHQANIRIIDAAQHRLGLPDSKVIKNIHKYGNTTAATIPLALASALEEDRLKRGDLVLMVSVGAGFTVGTVLARWSGV